MEFIQIVEACTTDPDALMALDGQWEQATEGKRTARPSIVTRDRNDPERYMIIVFSDSYKSAMENSAVARDRGVRGQAGGTGRRPMTFHDLDVVADKS